LYDPETELEANTFSWSRTSWTPADVEPADGFVAGTEIRVRWRFARLLHKHIATELRYPTRFIGFDAPK
jgi:hypothetical protein